MIRYRCVLGVGWGDGGGGTTFIVGKISTGGHARSARTTQAGHGLTEMFFTCLLVRLWFLSGGLGNDK